MSAKSRFFGLPTAVVDNALARGAHADCMISMSGRTGCSECRLKVQSAIDRVYAYIPNSKDRTAALIADTAREQADGAY